MLDFCQGTGESKKASTRGGSRISVGWGWCGVMTPDVVTFQQKRVNLKEWGVH